LLENKDILMKISSVILTEITKFNANTGII